MELPYSIHIVPDATTHGEFCYLAYHPELPGCMTHGKTVEEAIQELQAARELYLHTLNELGQPIPQQPEHPVVAIWKTESVAPVSFQAIVSDIPKAELSPVH